jgi:hypothetical protein
MAAGFKSRRAWMSGRVEKQNMVNRWCARTFAAGKK